MLNHFRHLTLLTVVLALLSGCAANVNYRTGLNVCNYRDAGDCAAAAIQYYRRQDEEYHLGFVEFDDQGQLRDRRQLEEVLNYFYPIAGRNDVLLVAFVHGWHHSAEPGDRNVQEFRGLLQRLARAETTLSRRHAHKPRKVLGLYVGWRGDSITIPWVNGITFWERKNTAHNIGAQGVAEVFLRLEEIVNVRAGMQETGTQTHGSRLVVMGHSFGGAVVFTALQQILTDRFLDSRRAKTRQDDAGGFGDLVVLLNPAFEAMRFTPLYDISQQGCRRYFSTQLPRLVVLTSEADWATKVAFPLGRFFSTLFETHTSLPRHYCNAQGAQPMMLDEGEADRKTIGHFETFRTHRLLPAAGAQTMDSDVDFPRLQQTWISQQPEASLLFDGVELQHLNRTRPLNPYLNIYVDGSLIGDHNDIWGDEIVRFIRDMIMISTLRPVSETVSD